MTRIAEIADRLHRLAKRREDEGIYTDAALCEEAAMILEHPTAAIGAGGQAVAEDWRDDPSADERWNAGLDYGQTQLCAVLGVDPTTIDWDAATETLDGDVQAVVGKILTARFGDDWPSALAHPLPLAAAPSPEVKGGRS